MSGYGCFARYYDALTENVDYPARAKALSGIIRRYMPEASLILDLACGTGSLTFELAGLGYEVIGADVSAEMLSVAMAKMASAKASTKTPLPDKNGGHGRQVLFLNQSMDRLDLYGTVDATVCVLDSVNHIRGEQALLAAFKKVALFTNPAGLFLFDANTPRKHRDVLGNNAFVYDLPDVFCCWQNAYHEDGGRVDITLDFFAPQENGSYTRETERFSEWAYSDAVLLELLGKAGFSPLETLDGDTFGPPEESSQRLLHVAKKAL